MSSRISPRLIDLVVALATGTVGAYALVRSDISDTLPGVAIAISLVPPLAVTGLPPQPAPTALRAALDAKGMRDADLELHLVGGRTHWCPADTTTCTVRESARS